MPDDPSGTDLGLSDSGPLGCMRCCCCCLCPKFDVCFDEGLICIGNTNPNIPQDPCVIGVDGAARSPAFCVTMCLTGTPGNLYGTGECSCQFEGCNVNGDFCSQYPGPTYPDPTIGGNGRPCNFIGATTGNSDPVYGDQYYWFLKSITACANPLEQTPTSCVRFDFVVCCYTPQAATLVVADPSNCHDWESLIFPEAICVPFVGGGGTFILPPYETCTTTDGQSDPTIHTPGVPENHGAGVTSIQCLDEPHDCLPAMARKPAFKCGPKPKMPGVFRQIATLAKATVQHVKHGLPMVDDEEKQRRLDICGSCEFYTGSRCLKCGCSMKHKAAWALEKCPVGKW